MNLDELRTRIDAVDRQMTALFVERMQISEAIGRYKQENHLPTADNGRERAKLAEVSAVPETIFVDETGSVVGESYLGARSKAEWQKIIDQLLEQVGEGA